MQEDVTHHLLAAVSGAGRTHQPRLELLGVSEQGLAVLL